MNQQQHPLKSKWSLWTNYAIEDKRQADYAANLVRLLEFDTLEELSFILKNTTLRDFDSFFVSLEKGTVPKFHVGNGTDPKRIEALNYFREDIEPTWEYGKNSHGGQFLLQVPRNTANGICEAVLLWVVGELAQLADQIIGVRFVDRVNWSTNTATVRIEIWVNFCSFDKEKVEKFGKDFNKIASGWQPAQLEFRNSK